MRHRHLFRQRLTLAALDDLIENGTLAAGGTRVATD
jgi:hypothetical protein